MKNTKTLISILLCLITSIIYSQKLTIEETLTYIENIENKYTIQDIFLDNETLMPDYSIKKKVEYIFDKHNGTVSKSTYTTQRGVRTNLYTQSFHINDINKKLYNSNSGPSLTCRVNNCIEIKSYHKNKYGNSLVIDIKQEYEINKVKLAFEYLFSLFDKLKLERDKDDPFAQFEKENEVSFKNSKKDIIYLKEQNGTYRIPIIIGGISKKFVLDSGASDTTISSKLEAQLIKNGTVDKENYLNNALYRIADGSIISQRRFVLKTLKVGNFTVKNIIISVGNEDSPLLLGKNFLDKFETWIINNLNKTIELKV